jgi:hypothetical protein
MYKKKKRTNTQKIYIEKLENKVNDIVNKTWYKTTKLYKVKIPCLETAIHGFYKTSENSEDIFLADQMESSIDLPSIGYMYGKT